MSLNSLRLRRACDLLFHKEPRLLWGGIWGSAAEGLLAVGSDPCSEGLVPKSNEGGVRILGEYDGESRSLASCK